MIEVSLQIREDGVDYPYKCYTFAVVDTHEQATAVYDLAHRVIDAIAQEPSAREAEELSAWLSQFSENL